ncbi:pyrimidine utilization protein D [Salinimonas lutimaris]|uniref:pyrimidine utilization protein D n=1 Tax=Salinimonas lutimaris TaxID=914153 RepID=UPI0010C1484C|nr:pyrimidine utilization protein D [Salinimonas lutimaris]
MHFEEYGLTSSNAPVLVFSSGLGGAARFWYPQLDAVSRHYRVIVYDQAGTNNSPQTLPANYRIADMAEELAELLGQADVQQCHLVGHALGGLVGLQLALSYSHLLSSLTLVNAWAEPNPHSQRCFDIRKALLAAGQFRSYLQLQALLLYPPDWIAGHAGLLAEEETHALAAFPDIDNLLARIEALTTFDITGQLGDIHIPVGVIANKDDALVPWQRSEQLANALPNATLSLVEYGGHASSVTIPEQFNQLLLSHLQGFGTMKLVNRN